MQANNALVIDASAAALRAFFAENVSDISRAGQVHDVKPGDTAFIQFSSGSTSEPKGVVLSHHNLIMNAKGAGLAKKSEEIAASF